jgi:tetrahydromethanopterin S-methyltransferase subunit B
MIMNQVVLMTAAALYDVIQALESLGDDLLNSIESRRNDNIDFPSFENLLVMDD